MRRLETSIVAALTGITVASFASAQLTPSNAADVPPEGSSVLRVENNGIDSMTCGREVPCRSIGQAITNAVNGQTILVGPGRYGDANGDGDYDDLGDERLNSSTFPGTCLVCVDKSLKILSTHGAELTVLDGAGSERSGAVAGVVVHAPNVVLGAQSKGFTISQMSNVGVYASEHATELTLEGNISSRNGVESDTASGVGFAIFVPPGTTRIRFNQALDNNFWGVFVGGVGGRARIVENFVAGNKAAGFIVNGEATHAILRNVSIRNGAGFNIDGQGHLVRGNVAVANSSGIRIGGSSIRIVENSIVGNHDAGIFIGPDSPGPIAVHRNNIFGNTPIGSSSSERNCGLTNQSGQTIDARRNFWGLASGPGTDPADAAGRDVDPGVNCDDGEGSRTMFAPHATERFDIPHPFET